MTQPPPTPGQQTVLEQLILDLIARGKQGIETYGEPLSTFNGRDAGLDAHEEWLDLGIYIKQIRMEQDALVTAGNRLARASINYRRHRRESPVERADLHELLEAEMAWSKLTGGKT